MNKICFIGLIIMCLVLFTNKGNSLPIMTNAMFPNLDFESWNDAYSLDNWVVHADMKTTQSTFAYSGAYSCNITTYSAYYDLIYLQCTPGDIVVGMNYTITAYFWLNTTDTLVDLRLQFLNNTAHINIGESECAVLNTPSNSWQNLTQWNVAPAGSDTLDINFRIANITTVANPIWLDSVTYQVSVPVSEFNQLLLLILPPTLIIAFFIVYRKKISSS